MCDHGITWYDAEWLVSRIIRDLVPRPQEWSYHCWCVFIPVNWIYVLIGSADMDIKISEKDTV